MAECEKLAEFALQTQYEDLSENAQRELKIRVLDTLGCAIGALEGRPVQIVRQQIDEFGGLAHRMPVFAAVFLIVTLSSIGLPGLNGFVGEFLVLLGTFGANRLRASVAATGVILSAVYMLWMYQRVIWGEITNDHNRNLTDLVRRERVMLIPLVILMVWMGVYSNHFLRPMDASVMRLLSQTESRRVEYAWKDFGIRISDFGFAERSPLKPFRKSEIRNPNSEISAKDPSR